MLQNGGCLGAAGALQQEMNSDIRAMALGGPPPPPQTASWEITALEKRNDPRHPRKTKLGAKSIYNPPKWQHDIYLSGIHSSLFSNCLNKFNHSKVSHHYDYLLSTNKCAL